MGRRPKPLSFQSKYSKPNGKQRSIIAFFDRDDISMMIKSH